MTRLLTICVAFWAIFDIGQSVSTKLEFDEEKDSSVAVSKSSNEDEDVEVKHTIVVSTKLKNNNRRGLHNNDGDNIAQIYSTGHTNKAKTAEIGEVPIIKGYKSVESTVIRTPDTRNNPATFSNSVFINRNIPEYYTYPVATNPSQWKPSTFFNNVNWWNDDNGGTYNDFNRRRNWPSNRNQEKFHRKTTDDGVKEFYCRKCRELSNGVELTGCLQQRSNSWFYETTTPKIKIDGKLAKLN